MIAVGPIQDPVYMPGTLGEYKEKIESIRRWKHGELTIAELFLKPDAFDRQTLAWAIDPWEQPFVNGGTKNPFVHVEFVGKDNIPEARRIVEGEFNRLHGLRQSVFA